MDLYPYQKKIVDEVMKNFVSTNRQLIVVPTGGGKTVIFSYIARILKLKTLIIAHTKELIEQCKKTIEQLHVRNVDIFSIQKCAVRMNSDTMGQYDLIIIDECHRSGAPCYMKIIDYYKGSKIIGVTATPFRHDGKKLKDIFGQMVSPLTLLDMIEQGLLCDFEGYRITTGHSLRGVSTRGGEFIPHRLAAVVNVKNRNELIVREYKKLSPGEKALCFAVNINHSDELANEFLRQGIPAKSVHGNIDRIQRKNIISDFKKGNLQVLVNCQILTEGFDEPSITSLLFARPTCSKILYTQMLGRGSRLYPGKTYCKVLEFTDNEYDVSSLEDLVNTNVPNFKIQPGERLSKYAKRLEKFLQDNAEETLVHKMEVIPKTIYEKHATSWQISFLKNLNIEFRKNITELEANQIISKETNG